jgi:hypothetical protein
LESELYAAPQLASYVFTEYPRIDRRDERGRNPTCYGSGATSAVHAGHLLAVLPMSVVQYGQGRVVDSSARRKRPMALITMNMANAMMTKLMTVFRKLP